MIRAHYTDYISDDIILSFSITYQLILSFVHSFQGFSLRESLEFIKLLSFYPKIYKARLFFKREKGNNRKGGNNMRMLFGAYIHQKCIEKEIPLREFARRIGVLAEYICNIEK